jgi:hypothetical protein
LSVPTVQLRVLLLICITMAGRATLPAQSYEWQPEPATADAGFSAGPREEESGEWSFQGVDPAQQDAGSPGMWMAPPQAFAESQEPFAGPSFPSNNADNPPGFSPDGTESLLTPPLGNMPELDALEGLPPETPLNRSSEGMGFGPGGDKSPIRYSAIWFPKTSVRGQSTDWGLVGQDVSLAYPIWIRPPNLLLVTAGLNQRLIQTDAVFPDSHRPYPNELWDAKVGLMYLRQLDGGRMVGGGINVESATDQPFHEISVGMNAMYRLPSGERNAWMFMLMYSPTSELQFPIPGVAFNYRPSKEFEANLGLPFRIVYRPTDRWSFEASYMLIHTIRAKASYQVSEQLKAFAGYSWANEAYTLHDREDSNDRFFLYDQRVMLGLEMPIAPSLVAEATAGYAFNRFSFVGRQWDTTEFDRVDIANGAFLSLCVSLRR